MNTQAGAVEMTLALRPGAALTGVLQSNEFGEAAIKNAKVDGDKISFQISISYGTVAFEGTAEGDEINFVGDRDARR